MEQRARRVAEEILRALEDRRRVTVALEGPCTSGKTALAARLAEELPCNVFHMDDFFLRPEQRTRERLAQVGGNVDYERFFREVTLPLMTGEPFSYRPYDCKTRSLAPPVAVEPRRINIVEGSYCLHPRLEGAYTLKFLLTVDPLLQRSRILERPAPLHRRFFEEWIPMENRYLQTLPPGKDLGCGLLLLP